MHVLYLFLHLTAEALKLVNEATTILSYLSMYIYMYM